jgi:hypothetical protein
MEGMEMVVVVVVVVVADDGGPAHNDVVAKDDDDDEEGPYDTKAIVMDQGEHLADKKRVGENEEGSEGKKVVVLGDEEGSTGKKTAVTDDWGNLADR